MLGGDGFLKWVQEHFSDGKDIKERDITKIKELKRALPIKEIARAVASEYGVPEDALLKKQSKHWRARQVLIELNYLNN